MPSFFSCPPITSEQPLMRIRCRSAIRFLAGAILLGALTISAKIAFAIGPDHYGYTATTTPFNFEDLTEPGFNPTGILDTGNDVAATIPIGFSFTFYGKTYSSLSVSSNGMITFQGSSV